MKTVELGSVATIERKAINPRSIAPETFYLGLEHIERGGRIIGRNTVKGADVASTKFWFTEDHVLFGKLRPNLGKIARPDFAGVCSTDILPIRPSAELDRNFLAHYLAQPSMIDFAASRTSGANLPRLSPAVLATLPILLPDIVGQRRIAAILDRAGAIRVQRGTILNHLDSLPQAIFHEMFKDFEWENEFGSVITAGPTNGLYRPASDYGDGVQILRIDSFSNGDLLEGGREWKRLRATDYEIQRYALSVGDFVINRVNALSHLGKSALVARIDEPSVYESNMMRIRADPDRVSDEFVLAWLTSRRTKQQVLARAKKAINQASINQADVRSLKLPLPPLGLQREFAERVKAINVQRASMRQAITTDDILHASLEAHAFRGEL